MSGPISGANCESGDTRATHETNQPSPTGSELVRRRGRPRETRLVSWGHVYHALILPLQGISNPRRSGRVHEFQKGFSADGVATTARAAHDLAVAFRHLSCAARRADAGPLDCHDPFQRRTVHRMRTEVYRAAQLTEAVPARTLRVQRPFRTAARLSLSQALRGGAQLLRNSLRHALILTLN